MRRGDRTHPLRECHGTTVKLARMLGGRVAQTSIVAAHVALEKLAVEQQNAAGVNHLDNLTSGNQFAGCVAKIFHQQTVYIIRIVLSNSPKEGFDKLDTYYSLGQFPALVLF